MRARHFAIYLLLGLLGPAWAQQEGITVTGRGVVYGHPDQATLELGVNVSDADVRRAVAESDSRAARLQEALLGAGVAEEDIRTIAYNVWREERYNPQGGTPEPPVYRADHLLQVIVDDVDRVGELLALAVEAGANVVGGISFGFSQPADLQARARELAYEDARSRAEQLAEAAGITLGRPQSIEEGTGGNGPGPVFERSAVALDSAPISAGQLAVEVRVTVRYAVAGP